MPLHLLVSLVFVLHGNRRIAPTLPSLHQAGVPVFSRLSSSTFFRWRAFCFLAIFLFFLLSVKLFLFLQIASPALPAGIVKGAIARENSCGCSSSGSVCQPGAGSFSRNRASRSLSDGGDSQKLEPRNAARSNGIETAAQQPAHAKTQKDPSSSKSDVLSRECFAIEGMGLHQLTISDRLKPGMLGLNGITDSTYIKLSCLNTYFLKHVPKSVFSYYCCVFAYARLLRLSQNGGDTLSEAEIAFVDFVDGSSSLLPEPVSLYLTAYGRTYLSCFCFLFLFPVFADGVSYTPSTILFDARGPSDPTG